MNYQYKLIVNNKNFYKEFEIPADMERVNLGTTSVCEFRLNPDIFFESIEISFERKEKWYVNCKDNLYISRGDIRKLIFTEVTHGDVVSVCYAESGETAFELRFMIDFEAEIPFYNRKVDIRTRREFCISDQRGADLELRSEFGRNTRVVLQSSPDGVWITEEASLYGVYVNGKKIGSPVILQESDFFSIADFSCYYSQGCLYFSNKDVFANGSIYAAEPETGTAGRYPKFVRNTRVKKCIDDKKIKILDPDSVPVKPELNIVTSLMPTLTMFALVVILRGIMNTSGGSYVIFSICSMGMGVVTSVLNIVNSQKKYKKDCEKRKRLYSDYIERKRQEIEKARQEELSCLRDTYYSIEEDLQHIESFSSVLFDRVPEDEDFLDVYLGVGNRTAKKEIDYKEQEKLDTGDELSQLPEKIAEEAKYIKNAPIIVSLKTANAVGIVGDREKQQEMLKNFIIDLISRQYYSDVNIYTFIDGVNDDDSWIRLLPHIQSNNSFRNIVCDNESKNNVFEYLYKELTLRSEVKGLPGYNVVLIMNEHGMKSHPISRFIEKASELNTVFVFFETREEFLPLYCSKIVKLNENNCGVVFDSANETEKQEFTYTVTYTERLRNIARLLSPVYCEEISLENSLRRNISLYELLGIYSAEDLDLKKRWKESRIYDTMAVPLGVNVKNDIVYLNLHEKFHGPHGLVAGTTGSGKSEILQSFILSAVTYFHPYEIGFVIIDFKGGGMVNQFKNLPHLIGAITNIDGNEVQRSLKSIKAELLKRQSNFAMAGVNHIDKYIQLYKEGKVSEALPHLIIIVDEFAELKAEQPEFMKELISTARIGRSLGVHLILATQKPSGVVDAQIWSNSKFKLCLKVQSKEDSNEVIKTPLAAEIKEPGRAYLQVGNNELFELFQSAYSGAPASVDASEIEKEFIIHQVNFSGVRKPIYIRRKQKKKEKSQNQLEAIVEYVNKYCRSNGIKKLADICMPPLPKELKYERSGKSKSEDICVGIGIVDDPDHQLQSTYYMNLTAMNYMLIGSAQTGKTNILQTIIRGLAENYTPEEVNIYMIDFGSMILRNFEKLNHVGGVVCSYEDEKLKSLFRLLSTEVALRKTKLAGIGVSSFSAYKEAGMRDLAQIVVLIDNMTALKELYLQEEDVLLPLCRDGNSVGISFVIANAQTAGIGYRYLNNFEGRMTLFCNETSEYSMMFEGSRMKLPAVPGRALVQREKTVLEAQMYIAFEGEKEFERVQAIREFAAECNKQYKGMKAKIIPEIPKELTVDFVDANYPMANREHDMMLGLDYATIAPVEFDMFANELLVLSGKKESGKDIFAKYLVTELLNKKFGEAEFYILDSIAGKWADYEFLPETSFYSAMSDSASGIIAEIGQRAEERYSRFAGQSFEKLQEEPWLVLLIESTEAISEISSNKSMMTVFRDIIGKYSGMKVFMLFTDISNASIPFNAPEVMKIIKERKKYVIFDEISNIKLTDLPLSLTRKYAKPLELHDAYFIEDNELKKIRTVK